MNKNSYLYKIVVLLIGLIFFAIGLSFSVHSGLGYDSWNVLHHGLSKILPINLGMASVSVSIIMMVIALYLGEPIGLSTILDSIVVGPTVQFIIDHNFLTVQNSFFMGIIYLFIGMTFVGIGSYFYMKVELGSGPRDSFTVAMSKKTGIKMGYMRSIVETTAVVIGIFLKGSFGIGTIIVAFFTGIITQIIFNIVKFDPRVIRHENIKETFENIFSN